MSCDAVERLIEFVYGNKKYQVDDRAVMFDLIVLPDDRVLEVGEWIGEKSLTPQGLTDTGSSKSDFSASGDSVDHLPVAEEVE